MIDAGARPAVLAEKLSESGDLAPLDGGAPAGPGPAGHEITGSASRPGVVALMPAERLGATNVSTVEVDPAAAEHARAALDATGYGVTTVTGDGTPGHPPGAPYDRVIATVAAGQVPHAWAEQTRPGGRVPVPWTTDPHNGALVSFLVSRDGSMEGRIVGNVAFMRLRDQRGKRASLSDHVQDTGTVRRSTTGVHPADVIGEYEASLAVGLRVAQCKLVVQAGPKAEGAYTVWLIDPWSKSWASLECEPGTATFPVRQHGERDLWPVVRC